MATQRVRKTRAPVTNAVRPSISDAAQRRATTDRAAATQPRTGAYTDGAPADRTADRGTWTDGTAV